MTLFFSSDLRSPLPHVSPLSLRPRKWKESGYGNLPTAAVMIPQYVSGEWEAQGKVVVSLASGSNKCLVLVECPAEAGYSGQTALQGAEASSAGGSWRGTQAEALDAAGGSEGPAAAAAAENARLKAQVQELYAQLHKAQGIFTQYLPMFSVEPGHVSSRAEFPPSTDDDEPAAAPLAAPRAPGE